jgi:hypothetical protein
MQLLNDEQFTQAQINSSGALQWPNTDSYRCPDILYAISKKVEL